MKLFVSVVMVIAGAVIGYASPRPASHEDAITVHSITDSTPVSQAKNVRTDNYATASLLSVKSVPTGIPTCKDGVVSLPGPSAVFTMSNGYGGTNISYTFEVQGGSVSDIHGDVSQTEHGYGTYTVPGSWNADATASYQAPNDINGVWQYGVDQESLQYRVHVTSPVDVTSDWYGLPFVSGGSCTVSTR